MKQELPYNVQQPSKNAGLFFWLIKMIGYIQELFAKFFAYIYGICSREESVTEETTLLDPREAIVYEDYMAKKDMKELNEIFSFVRNKENAMKRKCKLR